MTPLPDTDADFLPEAFLLDLLTERLEPPYPRLNMSSWAQIVVLARQHRILPCLEPALAKVGLALPGDHAITPETKRRWQIRALSLQAEALRIHAILSDAGIEHIFLKGIVMASLAYPNPAMRLMRDIDVLVRPSELARTRALLVQAGGELQHMAHKPTQALDESAKHGTPVWSPGRVVSVEIHGHLSNPFASLAPGAFARFKSEVFNRATQVQIGGHALPSLSPEDMCLHLVIHGIYDHELNNGPVFATDLLHLLRSTALDGVLVQRRAVDLGIAEGLALSLSLLPSETVAARELAFGGPDMPRDLAAALLFQDSRYRSDLRLSADLAERSALARLRLLFEKAIAPRHVMLDRWQREQGLDASAPSTPWLWLWFLRTRCRQMLAVKSRSADAATQFSVDLREHLLTLRMLRTSRK